MQKIIIYLLCTLLFITLFQTKIESQSLSSNIIPQPNYVSSGLAGNSIAIISGNENIIWLGTGSGLSCSVVPLDEIGYSNKDWLTFTTADGLPANSISAIALNSSDDIWVSTVGDTTSGGENWSIAYGFSHTTDGGKTWTNYRPNGADFIGKIPYDITLNDTCVYAACWYGGLLRFKDDEWSIIMQDSTCLTDPYNYENPVGWCYSTTLQDSILWVGTGNGVARAIYEKDWTWFTHQDDALSGNWVIALGVQDFYDERILWASTKSTGAFESERNGVSITRDNGITWDVVLENESIWNFAFDDHYAWLATSNGILYSTDLGTTWQRLTTDDGLPNNEIYSIIVLDDWLWVGTTDGLARYRLEDGEYGSGEWQVFYTFLPTFAMDYVKTYAFPNPFSPARSATPYGKLKIVYSLISNANVSITIYDTAEEEVIKLLNDVYRDGDNEYMEIWNGKNREGENVSNGIYFYKIELDNGRSAWGKIAVMD